MYKKLLAISKKVGIPVKEITDFLFLLKDGKPIENNELVRKLGVSRNVVNQVKESLASLLMPVSNNTQLKDEALKSIESIFQNGYSAEQSLLSIKINISVENFLEKRLDPLRKYDQFTATPETVAKRVSLLNFLGDIKGKRILFLGDDDFTSIAVAELGLAEQISVLDIDTRILNSIDTISEENNFNIKTFSHDIRNPLTEDLGGKFDIVFTDPPYTSEGISLFVSRAVDALDKTNQSARIYFCYGNSDRAKERFLPIYESIVNDGLMIRYVFDKFNRYEGAESIGSSSSLFITEITPKTRSTVKGKYERPIYTNN
jgi:predicted RNA methylase